MRNRPGPLKTPICKGCGEITGKKARKGSAFCSDRCGCAQAQDVVDNNYEWCPHCREWVYLQYSCEHLKEA